MPLVREKLQGLSDLHVLPVTRPPVNSADSKREVSLGVLKQYIQQGMSGGGASPAYDLDAQSGNFTPDLANGNRQYCWLNGNLTLFGPSGSEDAYPKEMDTFEFLIQWASGNYTLDFSGIQYPTDLSGVLPVTLEQYRSYLVTLRFQGGQWCLFAVHGPFVESVD